MERPRSPAVPSQPQLALTDMGAGLRTARIRRRQSARDLADRIGVSMPTLRKLERGDPTLSLGTFVTALWTLGLLAPVRDAIRPEHDRLAAAIEASNLPKRVRRKKDVDLDRL